jgi:uncharacterized membrane protein HdeD (DUF308 family)
MRKEAFVMSQMWTERVGRTDRAVPRRRTWIAAVGLSGDDLRHARRWLLVTAALCVLAGLAAIAVPLAASVATAIFIGWVLAFAGVVTGVHAFVERAGGRSGLRILTAVLTLFVGIYLIVAPLTGTVTLTFMLAVWFFAIGVLELTAAWGLRGWPGAGLVGFNGALSALLGVLIVADFPSSADWAIGLLVGINLLLWGIRAFVLAGLLKRAIDA